MNLTLLRHTGYPQSYLQRFLAGTSSVVHAHSAHWSTTMTKPKGPPDYRDSKTGEFVKKDYAEKHKSTTEKEHNRPPVLPQKKK